MRITQNKRWAFVVPRFGRGIIGGAETLVGALATALARRGDYVEVLTTCAKDNRTWSNECTPGKEVCEGVVIHRFLVNERNLDIWIEKQISVSKGLKIGLESELSWMENGVNSSTLYSYIEGNADEFDAIFFAPYLFGTTFFGSLLRPDKSILIPCLHDECYANTEIIGSMFRQVRKCLFNSYPEQVLAKSLYGEILGGEVGMGFEKITSESELGLEPYFQKQFPYLLYAGRKETGKNAHLLIDSFCWLKDNSPYKDYSEIKDLKLVIMGGGAFEDLERPGLQHREDIVDLPSVSEVDKLRVMKHASFLCQPSLNESFSIVIMECWLLGTPVLVHENCAVTRHHVVSSGGGLYYSSSFEFARCCLELVSDQKLRLCLGLSGREYVHSKYSWSSVLARFDAVVNECINNQSSNNTKSLAR